MLILSKVDADTALELLQINRFTRNYVLENRSYPESIKLTVAKYEPSVSLKYKGSTKETEEIHLAFAHFQRVHSCDVLEICAGTHCYFGTPPLSGPPARLWKIFPNLQLITDLKSGLGFRVLTEIFESSKAQIVYQIDWSVQYFEDRDEKPFFAFARDHLTLCTRIDCLNQHTYKIWPFLKTMSFEHITVSAYSDWDAVDIFRQVLDEGRVPSLATSAELHCVIYKEYLDREGTFQEDLMNIVSDMLELGPLEPLHNPPEHWAGFANNSFNWQFRRAVTTQRELCMWVNCDSDTFSLNILHRPIAK